ncbi:hypothetical protein [Methylobacterium dankookense]|uniref:Uncharacterized protein n=1 Tax=Methylobacterium dankookense TaxID=560405 RepID=A0A564G2T8_9HYPH|nr:hypothetical protein [Methylobacterium dankookense]GJD54685.1 hypothetical protein IFDJLNFL_0563 [Methylobacterium dankookense]VUF14422.1 hypothetical protein MTDSW087_04144 [Methylobacterium dankookense]
MRAACEMQVPREKVAEIERLAMALAARLRYAQMVSLPVPDEQVSALARAAQVLSESRVPPPSLVRQVLREAADGGRAPPGEPAPDAPGLLVRLGRNFRIRRRRRHESLAEAP